MQFPRWLRAASWSLVVGLGVTAFLVLAWSRGEQVNALWLVVAAVCVFVLAYRFHSAWLMARVLTLDERRATPAMVYEDGRDFVKTNRWIVFGHHFAAIAGPGPLVGPVLAAQFGFLPGMLWILVGATLGGAVHDSIILFCSTRRRGKSLGQMVREEVGPFSGLVALISIIAIMIILLAVLALVVVRALAESPWGIFTIAATMPIAVLMGLSLRFWTPGKVGLVSAWGVAGLLLAVAGGQWLHGTALEGWLTLKGTSLAWWIMGYGLIASVLPVWLLLAPRDYLSTFMKIGTVALLGVAIVFIAPTLKMPALTRFIDGSGPVFAGPVFPFCFITIACAAISGFHSLVASGTTPKLITRESDIRIIAYGGMITEMLVGIMALIAACAMEPGQYFAINMKGDTAAVTQAVTALGFPVTPTEMAELATAVGERTMVGRTGGAPTFAVGMAHIFSGVLGSRSALALWYHFAIMFEALFILTTIDAGTRVGRFLVQDMLSYLWKPLGETRSMVGNWAASVGFVAAWGWFLYQGVIDPLGGINSLWPIFGVANQLLAVVALALGTTVLIKMGRQRYLWVSLAPLGWLLAVTMTAGWMKIFSADPRLGFLSAAAEMQNRIAIPGGASVAQIIEWKRLLANNYINAVVTGVLLVLVILVVVSNARVWVQLLAGRRIADLKEEPYVPLSVEPRVI
ncbi:MAG: carbon starvation protein A [Verrucomicrobia bacterium RIFCSPLOWO2_12_FULL_64_8]|nr:MAG: carbon starvation protein A [Verrucomicrobia bacterium RIFCSPLOWO2_12_FULL_64_8]